MDVEKLGQHQKSNYEWVVSLGRVLAESKRCKANEKPGPNSEKNGELNMKQNKMPN